MVFGRFGLEILLGFPCFACMPHRAPLTRNWLPLEAWILAFFGPWSWWLHHLFVCGCIASSFCFFRPSERNVRQFYGGWFWQVWAWILLGFPCFACMPHRALWRGIGFRLGLNPRVLRALILVVASSFVCGCIASPFCFFRPSERNVRHFYGGWFWQVWAWILLGFFLVSHACPTEPFDEELASAWGLNPRVLRALILVVASSFVCGCIASSFCFFRPSERNVRQFYGGWFWQVWAWILLGFCRFGTTHNRALSDGRGHFHGAAFQTCGMSCWGFFACGCTAGVCIVVALLGFLCLWLHHLSFSFRPSERNRVFFLSPTLQGSAAWAAALQSGRRPLPRRAVSLPEAFGW